jgi:hypothetical protein
MLRYWVCDHHLCSHLSVRAPCLTLQSFQLFLPLPLEEELFELFVLLVLHFLHWCRLPRPHKPFPLPGLRPLAQKAPPLTTGPSRVGFMSPRGSAAEHPSTHGCLVRLRS